MLLLFQEVSNFEMHTLTPMRAKYNILFRIIAAGSTHDGNFVCMLGSPFMRVCAKYMVFILNGNSGFDLFMAFVLT